MDASGRRFAVIVSRWNELVTKQLLDGAVDELERHGADEIEVVHVPGTWEIPAVATALLSRPDRPDGIVALGCILQGATAHANLLATDVGEALMRLQTDHGLPIAWGILTPETQDQAWDRAGLKLGNKGREAALAAIETVSVIERISRP